MLAASSEVYKHCLSKTMLMNGNAILHCFELHKVNHHSSYCCSSRDGTDQRLRVSGNVICKKTVT